MAMPFSLFLALKYLKPKRTFVSIVSIISVLGVLIGVAVLVIVLSVMSGFDQMWRDKILGFNAHITVTGWRGIENERTALEVINAVEGVTGAAPYVQGLVFVQADQRIFTPFLRGIDPQYESTVSRVPQHMVRGKFEVTDDSLLIGRDLALRLAARLGDKILVYSPASFTSRDELHLPEELAVNGIFELGMWDFDIGYVLTSLDTARELCGMESGVTGIQVMTRDPFQAGAVAERIQEALGPGYRVQTWKELNRQLFAALQVEKNMMFFLLIFITVVAAFGITNTLITVAVQKTREIGLMKALGFTSGSIMRVFIWQGWIAGLIGTLSGIGSGLLILRFRNDLMDWLSTRLHVELLPKELYQLSKIPCQISVNDILMVAVTVMVICTLAGVIPAWRAARLDPARSLRYE